MKKHPCPGNPFARSTSRREFLHVGVVSTLGLTLPTFLRQQAGAALKHYDLHKPVAQSVINIFLPGGMAHQESFDPKPFAPSEYRGPFGSIETALPGVSFGEKIPKLAKIADQFTVIRSMTHGEAAHERGTHNMFTGYRPSPALQYPSVGSVISHELGPRENLPPYVCIPQQPNEFASSGYLSSAHGPFTIGSEPSNKNFQVRDLNLPEGVSPERFERRRSLLDTVDAHFRDLESSDQIASVDAFYDHAYKLISSQKAREAFDIKQEAQKTRDFYGNHAPGQRMLLARRLVEAGTRFVSLTAGGWDHHQKIKDNFQKNMPNVDHAVAALLSDLGNRGMLDNTLVMLTTEFGRTPKINKDGGRDHWPRVFSVMLAGGGVKKGMIYGSSDSLGGEPEENAVSAEDLMTTVYHQLGITADKELMAPGARPVEIVDGGQVINGILENKA